LTRRFNFQTNHIVFKPSNFGIIEDIVFSLEEPFGDLIIAANYILAQKASSSVKVVLSGEGGDEAFFGYDHERAFIKLMGLANNGIKRFLTGVALNLPSQIIGLAKSYPGKFGNDEVSRVRNVFGKMSDPAEAYLELVSLFSDKELGLLLKSNFSVQADTLPIKEIFSSDRETWQAIIRAEIEQLTLIVNLLKQERFGMCFSMEGRVPLISRKILEFAASLSFRELFPFVNKKLLLNYSNQRVVTKTPFSFLSNTWYQNAVIRLLDNYVTRESVEENGILSWPAIQGLRLSLEKGYMISIKKAMAVIIFHVWCRVFREKGYLH
jgi:asparagine synthase (glutamine-hydrolysing)